MISSPKFSKVTLSEYLGSAVACSSLLSKTICAPDSDPTINSPIKNDPVGVLSFTNPSSAFHSTKFAVVHVELPVTNSGTVKAPVIPAGAGVNDADADVYPLPALVISISLTLL